MSVVSADPAITWLFVRPVFNGRFYQIELPVASVPEGADSVVCVSSDEWEEGCQRGSLSREQGASVFVVQGVSLFEDGLTLVGLYSFPEVWGDVESEGVSVGIT